MIRPYKKEDLPAALELFRKNTPEYFAPSEEVDFVEYLDQLLEDYFVLEDAGRLVGCGGINYFEDEKEARISWDMVDPEFQGKGIGRKLVEHRLSVIKNKEKFERIRVRTSQLAYAFYQKFGFELEGIEKDFWAPGLDLYQMSMKINHQPK